MKAVQKEDLAGSCRVTMLPEGQNRLEFDLANKKDENSCLVSYF